MIRHIRVEDAKEFLAYFKKLTELDPERVERPEDIATISIEAEQIWIQQLLNAENADEMIVRCIDLNGKIVGIGEIEKKSRWIERHVAEIRFGLLPDCRGYGRELVSVLEERSKSIGIELLIYFHFERQIAGLNIMRSAGYKEVGRIPRYYKRESGYIDRIYLSKLL